MNKRHQAFHIHSLLFASVLFTLGLTGCDGVGANSEEMVPVELRFQVASSGAGKTAAHVEVEQAKLLVKTVQFNAEDGEEYEVNTESFVVDLGLSRRANAVKVGAVPPGVYKRLTFKIHKPEDDEAVPDPVFREGSSGDERFSLVVSGRIEDEPFVLKIRESIQQRMAFAPLLDLEADDRAVTVTLLADVDAWFVGEEGEALDPRREDDADDIAEAIEASFQTLSVDVDDDDEDDDDDDDDGQEDNDDG